MYAALQNMMYSSIQLGELPFAVECFNFSETLAEAFFLPTDEILLDLSNRRAEMIEVLVGALHTADAERG